MPPTPEEVIEAVRALNADTHMHDQAAVAWEQGTAAIVVFVGDRTDVYRYKMSEDLSEVLSIAAVRKVRK
jgi:hypothetical protein